MKEYLLLGLQILTVFARTGSDGKRTGNTLIQNDWETLEKETQIRYFHPSKYYPGGSEDEIWNKMGEDISCKVNKDLSVNLGLPLGFDNIKPFKVFTHGFSSTVKSKTAFVNAWMQTLNLEVNVILVDWPGLASIGQITDWDSYLYDSAARNSIDVGEYLGHCLAALTTQAQVPGSSWHLLGHSLGAHLMGKAGRTYNQVVGNHVDRVTGFDPAGPRFVDGPLQLAIPELHENRLNTESADFVDVIHTDGSLTPAVVWITPHAGDLHPMGHMDFYPNGGSEQPGCGFEFGVCNHRRSYFYYLHSIWEPELFPARECSDVEECNEQQADVEECNEQQAASEETSSYMGEISKTFISSEKKLYIVDIKDQHWDYDEHNRFQEIRL